MAQSKANAIILCACTCFVIAGGSTTGVRNFRPVSSSLPGVYRCAAPEVASAADIALFERLQCVFIDLRNNDEVDMARRKATPEGLQLLGAIADSRSSVSRVHIPVLADVDAFFDAVERRLPLQKGFEAFLWKLVDGRRLNEMLYDAVSQGGNALLNTAMLECNVPAWGRALEAVADGLDEGRAVVLHCAQGKDRTGVLSALLQSAVGDTEEDIVRSYALSEELLDRKTTLALTQGDGGDGVDWSNLHGSPPRAMVETLRWLEQTYGGADRFIAAAGCNDRWRTRIMDASVRLDLAMAGERDDDTLLAL